MANINETTFYELTVQKIHRYFLNSLIYQQETP